jgi:hypothetical protein
MDNNVELRKRYEKLLRKARHACRVGMEPCGSGLRLVPSQELFLALLDMLYNLGPEESPTATCSRGEDCPDAD